MINILVLGGGAGEYGEYEGSYSNAYYGAGCQGDPVLNPNQPLPPDFR